MRSYITLKHNPTTITGDTDGVFGLAGTAWTVVNESTVGYYGIQLRSGGTVINDKGASSAPGYTSTFHGAGVFIRGGSGAVTNFGTLEGGWGVLLYGGGTVANRGAKAVIEGSSQRGLGVEIKGGRGSVTNYGTIRGSTGVYLRTQTSEVSNYGEIYGTYGVVLKGGGTVVNGGTGTKGALIIGSGSPGYGQTATYGQAVDIRGGPGLVRNLGTITGPSAIASGESTIKLGAGGTVINGSTGATRASISGYNGILIGGGRGRVTNFGTIEGGKYGVSLYGGGTVINGGPGASRSLIEGRSSALRVTGGPATVTNFGTIKGDIAFAIEFAANSRLVVEAGAKFIGGVGAAGKDDTIELAAKSSGTLQLEAQFSGFDKVVVDRGANWRIALGLKDLKATTISGDGSNVLALSDAGTIDLSLARGFPTISLSGAGANTLTLASSNFIGIAGKAITVAGGAAADTLSEAGVSGLDKAVLNGGGGADTLIAGRNAVLTGGGAKDVFELTVAGSPTAAVHVTIADFTHGWDKLALSEKGFGLGAKPTAATLFASNATGRFTNSSQRFAYNTANGALFFDGRGNAAGSTRLEIATLSKHPTLTAGDITFVA